jgi:peptidoglycan-N-acetylglucosamine deacetylase
VSWILDDFPHFEYVSIRSLGLNYPGHSAPSKVEEIWQGEFTFMQREIQEGVFTLTMHPQVIGRGHRMLMLERLIDWFKSHSDTHFSTLGAAAQTFREAHPRQPRV